MPASDNLASEFSENVEREAPLRLARVEDEDAGRRGQRVPN